MKKEMNKYIAMLMVAIAAIVSFSSCTDQDDIDISYGNTINVTASHIFDSFQRTMDDDFSLNGTAGTWTLNLHSYIYDSNGNIIDKAERSFNNLSSVMSHELTLSPGKYTIISIAEFDGSYGGTSYKFWNISNEDKLSELTIQESETICNSAMETLGVDTKEIEITNNSQIIQIDIKPITGLVEMIIWDDDFSGSTSTGYSYYAPYINDLTIYSQQLKQIVKFDGTNPTFDYGIQAVRYPMQTHSPSTQVKNGGSKQILGYRALLPDNNKQFYWELNTISGAGKYLFTDGNDFQISDLTENSVNIESGKQYVTDLILDSFHLYLDVYDSNVDMFTRVENYINGYNKELIEKALAVGYDKYIGMSKSQFESYVDFVEFYTSGNNVSYIGSGLITYLTVVFDDDSFSSIKRIMLVWGIDSTDKYNLVADCLSDIYTVWDKGTTSTVKQYINGSSLDYATVLISWSSSNYCLYYDRIDK